MDPKIQKVFRVSDGLTSFAHKKVTGLVRELEKEGVLTSQEGKRVINGLSKVKKAVYDNISAQLKKVLSKKASSKKKDRAKKRR